jgi:hypothetical protein
VTITDTGEIVFDNGVNVYALPSSCWAPSKGFTLTSGSTEPTCGTFGEPSSQAVQLTADGTTSARDEHPTWTSATLTPYSVPGGSPASVTPPTAGKGPASGPPAPPVSPLGAVTPGAGSVVRGKSLTLKVTLKAASRLKVEILRYVPASGHGRHRHKAHYVLVETLDFAGKPGLNKLAIPTKHDGRAFAPGKYEAKVLAGTSSRVVSFTVKTEGPH